MVDSTNAEVPGFTTSEREITPVLDRVFAAAERRIIVASFASHVHRVQQVLDAARAARPPGRTSSAARWSATWASPGPGLPARARRASLVDTRAVDDLPDEQVVLMCTGSQGEPMAALSRMANRDHRIRVGPRRHRGAGVVADPGQRERGLPGDQRADPARRQGGAPGQRPGARLRARQRRRAALLLQHRPPAQRDAGARRGPAPRRQRRARGRRPASRAERVVVAEDGVVVDLVDGVARVAGAVAVRLRLRRRLHGRRDHRGRPEGPPDPRRGGLHLDHRGGRLRQRQGGRRAGDPRPRLRRGRRRLRRRSGRGSWRRWPRPRAGRRWATPTSCSRWSAGWWAAG